jgi:hypothetical protein
MPVIPPDLRFSLTVTGKERLNCLQTIMLETAVYSRDNNPAFPDQITRFTQFGQLPSYLEHRHFEAQKLKKWLPFSSAG